MQASRKKRSADVWIEESSRPYSLSVQELVDTGAIRKFHIDTDEVESCIAQMMIAVERFEPDTLLAASTILFIMIVRRFQLKMASVIQFAENFLNGGDRKPACAALQLMLRDDFENRVTRYEAVKLSRPVNLTKVLNSPPSP